MILFSGGWIGGLMESWPVWAQILVLLVAVLIIGFACMILGVICSKPPERHL